MIPGEAHILNTSTNVEWLSNRHRTYFVDRYSIHSCISSKYVSGYCLLYSSWVKCHLLVGHKKGSMINWYGILFVRLPVSQGFRPTVISPPPGPNPWGSRPPGGQIPWDLAPPCAPPFRDLAPPPPSQRHISENILVFRPSYQESFWNMVWQFIWQWICASHTQSQCCLIFSKVDFVVVVYVNIVLQLRAWFCCVFLILPNLSIVSWVILVSD